MLAIDYASLFMSKILSVLSNHMSEHLQARVLCGLRPCGADQGLTVHESITKMAEPPATFSAVPAYPQLTNQQRP